MHLPGLVSEYWFYIILVEAVFAFAAASIARFKNRDQGYWFIFGFLFSVVGVALIAAMKKQPDDQAPKNNLLLDPGHYVRSGWRIVLFFVALLFLYYLSAVLAKLTGVVPSQSYFFLFYLDVLLVTYMMLRFVDRRRFMSVGFPNHGKIRRELLLGFLMGTVMISIVAGASLICGAVKLELRPGQNLFLVVRNFGLSFLMFGFFSMGEEIVFRGYPFQALVEGLGPMWATVVMSLFFGAVHLTNPDASLFSTVNTILAGVWLSVAYLKTRALYFPFGMHFSWNLVQSFFFSLPVSGLMTNRTIFIPTDFGPEWLTGGRYGPEAGVGTTVLMIIGVLILLLWKGLKPAYDYEAAKGRITTSGREPISPA